MFTTENKVSYAITEDFNFRSQSETETIIQDLRYSLATTQKPKQLLVVVPAKWSSPMLQQ